MKKLIGYIAIILLFTSLAGVNALIIGGREGAYFNGTIDEVRVWGRALSATEALQHYYSNLYRYGLDGWSFYTNQSDLTDGYYTYYGCALDIAGNINCTEERVLNVEAEILDTTPPSIEFVPPTETQPIINYDNIFVNVTATDVGKGDNNISVFVDFDRSLVGWWRMDQFNGTHVLDNSSYGNDASVNDSPIGDHGFSQAYQTDGYLGKGFRFSETNSNYISIPDSDSLDLTNQLTLSAWVRNYDISGYHKIIVKRTEDNNTDPWELYAMDFVGSGKVPRFVIDSGVPGDGNRATVQNDSFIATLGEWHHIVGTYNGSLISLYIDGILVNSTPANFDIGVNDMPVTIGGRTDMNSTGDTNPGWSLNSSIDDVMIFNRALKPEEVEALYADTSQTYLEVNFTELVNGNHTFKAYAQDTAGNVNMTEEREVEVLGDIWPPAIWFENSTSNGTIIENNIFVNVSATDVGRGDNNISVFVDFDNSLVGWWRFDNNIYDETGINNDSTNTLRGNVSYVNGMLGKGIYFDGVNDSFLINSTNSINEFAGSINFWFNRKGLKYENGIARNYMFAHFTRYPLLDVNRVYIFFNESDNKLYTYMQDEVGYPANARLVYDFGAEFGKWHHISLVWNNGNYSVYLDGVQKLSDIYYNASLISFVDGVPDATTIGAETLHFGAWDGTDVNFAGIQEEFNGSIDDIIIFNRTLSAEEIVALYANTSSKYLMHNFTNLAEGDHTFKAYAQDTDGNVNYTEERMVTVESDIIPPAIWFENSTSNGTIIENNIFVNVSATDVGRGDNNISVFVDFDNSLVGWWRMDDVGDWCYQETANESTACGGESTGNYSCEYMVDCANAYDGDWDTYGYPSTEGVLGIVYINYTKPLKATSLSKWELKTEESRENHTIPEECWNQELLQFKITPVYSGIGSILLAWCWDGATWIEIEGINHPSSTSYRNIYEEAMNWFIEDSGGSQVADMSEYINTGTIYDNAHQTEGYLGKGMEFDGDGDYVDVGNMDIYGDEMTISAWFKVDTLPIDDYRIISKAISTDNDDHWWMLSLSNDLGPPGRIRARIKTDGVTTVLNAGSGDLEADVWTHAVFVYDGSNMILYKDNVEVGRTPKTGIISIDLSVDVNIGRNPGGAGFTYFNGTIDDVMIFNRRLSSEEIAALYANTSSKYLFHNFTDLADGDHIFKAYAQDNAGNVNSTERTVIINSAPTHTMPVINSSDLLNRTNGTLYCWNQSTYDADGDAVTNYYKWFNNSKLLAGEEVYSLGPGNFSKGDNVTCEITPSDGQDGISLNASILIRNSMVNITKIEITDNSTDYSNMYLTPIGGSRAKAAIRAIISDIDGASNQSVTAYLCDISKYAVCNESSYTYAQNLTYLEEAPGSYNYYYTYNGTEEMPQFWRTAGTWKLYVKVLDEEFSDYNETDFDYVELWTINYSSLVKLGGETNINLGEWNNGTNKYVMTNWGNVNLSITWNASDLARQGGGGLWTLNGTDFAVDDDNDYALDVDNIPWVFLNGTKKIFEPASGLLTCDSDSCVNENSTLDTYYHIAPQFGLPGGTYDTTININVSKK